MGMYPSNISYEELIYSATAEEKGINNSAPNVEVLANLFLTAHSLQCIRDALEKKFGFEIPLYISSGFRCEELNEEIGGVDDSAHIYGLAADIVPGGITVEQLYEAIEEMENLPFDQLILEKKGNSEWVHIGFREPATYLTRFEVFKL